MSVNRLSIAPSTAFHTQGPLPPDAAHLYVLRPADTLLEKLIDRRETIALIGPRLSGKSSMLLRQWARLRASPRVVPVYIALGTLQHLTEPEWYAQLHARLAQQAGIDLLPPDPGAPQALVFQATIVDALEGPLRGRTLVIMLDQVEAVPPAFGAAFFATLREMAVNRWMEPALQNVAFVLAGRFMPDDLIRNPTISPFRVAETVYVSDADLEALTYLVAQLAAETRQIASDVPERIFEWTEGDIYLTHRLCAALAQDVPEGAVLLADVDRAVRRHLFEDELFGRMWRQIQADPDVSALVATLLHHRETVRFTLLQRPIMQAWLEGAVRPDPLGNCVLRSLVHESVFFALQKSGARAERARRPALYGRPGDEGVLHGRYRIDHVIHPGMTSYVYRGTDLGTGEMVAIKQLMVSREMNEMAWHRFQREAEALKQLDHPNIVRLRDAFRDDDFEYIVMEYVYGGSLFDRLNREGRLPLRQVLLIAEQLASALEHAHARGIIHRDVKPSNIMLTVDYTPLLADFGIARLTGTSTVTQPRTLIGTTPYLSPEACLGDPVDARGDLWSLGIILYEMLAGSVPFTGRTDEQIARAILDSPLPDLRAIRPDVPDAIVALLNDILAKHPADRIASARAVHDRLRALRAALNGDSRGR